MRNVAFAILMFALAAVQIAVVSSELSHSRSHVQAAAPAKVAETDARYVVASTGIERKASGF